MSGSSYIPLNDRPREQSDPCNAARLGQVREALVDQLAQAMRARQDIDGDLPRDHVRCIGLFGGLGQGKSSVVRQTLEQLKKEHPNCRDYCFNVSDYATNDLARDFDRIVGMWKSWREHFGLILIEVCLAIAVVGILIVLLNWVLPDVPRSAASKGLLDSFRSPRWLVPVGVGVVLFSSRGPFRFWWRGFERHLHIDKPWMAAKVAFTDLWWRPDIIIVDDLDRATVAQQRAMLRSIHRFSQQLPYLFVICMDESLLLAGARPDPEDPADLLRKVIQVELRLPARVPEDAILLGMAIIAEASDRNRDLEVLRNPLFQADFCLLLSLLTGFGPRLAKRLLNDALLHARELGVLDCAEDCAALARLHLYLAEFPTLRGRPHRLTRLLEGRTRFEDSGRRERFERLNGRCTHVRPLDNDWRRLIGAFGATGNQRLVDGWPRSIQSPVALFSDQTDHGEVLMGRLSSGSQASIPRNRWNSEASLLLWKALDSIRLGYGDRQIEGWRAFTPSPQMSAGEISPVAIEGLVLVHAIMMLGNTEDAVERQRLLDYLSPRLGRQRGISISQRRRALEAMGQTKRNGDLSRAFDYLEYLLLRVRLGDPEVAALTQTCQSDDRLQALSRLDSARRIHLLPLLGEEAIEADAMLSMLLDFESGATELDVSKLRHWLHGQTSIFSQPITSRSSAGGIGDVALLNQIWPPSPPASDDGSRWLKLLELHLSRWRELKPIFPELWPDALVAWLEAPSNWESVIRNRRQAAMLSALRGLFVRNSNWDTSLWNEEWGASFKKSLLGVGGLNDEQWEIALLIACLSGGSKPWELVRIRPIVSPSLARFLCSDNLGKILWQALSSKQLEKLFNGLLESPWLIAGSGEWENLRRELGGRIPDLLKDNPNRYAILTVFDLNPVVRGT